MTVDPRQYLERARASAMSGDFSNALYNYEYFFDHALDEDPHSLYGVRLSYCLSEWVRLGKEYPEAHKRLEKKKENTRALLLETKQPELFHDYETICEHLGKEEESMEFFLFLHETEPKLATTVVRFIWDRLVTSKNWNACLAYLGNAESRYEKLLQKYDQAMSVCRSNPDIGDEDFANQIESWFVRDASNLLIVLKNTNQHELAAQIYSRVDTDTKERKCEHLKIEVSERVGL